MLLWSPGVDAHIQPWFCEGMRKRAETGEEIFLHAINSKCRCAATPMRYDAPRYEYVFSVL